MDGCVVYLPENLKTGELLMAVATTNEVADWFIRFAHEVGDPITNLRLQKLMYYAQAWYLALNGEQLIPDTFEAWAHGPVIPSLYERFSAYRWNPISEDVPEPRLPAEVEDHLREVDEAFGGRLTWELERLSHTEPPWLLARGNLAPDEHSTAIISEDEMKRYYASRVAA
jgi:uncharacterized phage-associated protein